MSASTKISISLPAETLELVERERRATGESRSELFRRAVENLFESARREAAIRQYVQGYVAEPETEYEVSAAEQLAGSAFDGEEWE